MQSTYKFAVLPRVPGQNLELVKVGELIIHDPPFCPPLDSGRNVAIVSRARTFDP